MRVRWFAALVLCLVMLASTLASADGGQSDGRSKDENTAYVCLYGGLNFGGNLFSGGPNAKLDFSNPKALGVAINFWGPGAISAEVDLGYYPEFFGSSDALGGNNLMTVTGALMIHPYTAQMGSQRIRPYFVIGGGLMRSKIEDFAILGKDVKNTGVALIGGVRMWWAAPCVVPRASTAAAARSGNHGTEAGRGRCPRARFSAPRQCGRSRCPRSRSVSYTHLRAHATRHDLVCRLL